MIHESTLNSKTILNRIISKNDSNQFFLSLFLQKIETRFESRIIDSGFYKKNFCCQVFVAMKLIRLKVENIYLLFLNFHLCIIFIS